MSSSPELPHASGPTERLAAFLDSLAPLGLRVEVRSGSVRAVEHGRATMVHLELYETEAGPERLAPEALEQALSTFQDIASEHIKNPWPWPDDDGGLPDLRVTEVEGTFEVVAVGPRTERVLGRLPGP